LKGAECVTLNEGESHHLVSVLRASRGTEVELIDGNGTVAKGYVKNPDKSAAQIAVTASRTGMRKFHLSLIQATLTNNNMDFAIREACAIGVSNICLAQGERSESKIGGRLETKFLHWNKLLIEACKQSGNPFLPKLSFVENIKKLEIGENVSKFFGHIGAERYFIRELISIGKPCDIAIAIGPEGDFSEEEKDFLFGKNFIGCKLSDTVLRSETAAIYALSVANNYVNSLC
jgi:16S rRNA (uracil1498-N3)-methyltransferase